MNEQDAREAAIKRLRARRDFRNHVVVYVVVNALLVLIWAVSGAGYFWPAWSILGWGIGLALHAWNVHGKQAITEEDIQREMQRHQP